MKRSFLTLLVEQQTFGVCQYLGEKLRISSASIRLFFIYASFIAFGSPVFIYMGLAFILDLRRHFRRKRSMVWDL